MNRIIFFLIGLLLIGVTAYQRQLFYNLEYLCFAIAFAGVVIFFYSFLYGFVKVKYILLGLILIEAVFWGYLKLMIYKQRNSFFLKEYYANFITFRHRSLIQFDKNLSSYDPELFYTLKPNTKGIFENFEFKTTVETSSMGTRDDKSSLDNPKIVTIGDSFTMGWGVEKEDMVSTILEAKTGHKVLNLGVSSYGTYREHQILKRADRDSLKLIILQYNETDIEENYSKLKAEEKGESTKTQLKESDYNNEVAFNPLNSKYFPLKGIHSILVYFIDSLKQKIAKKPTQEVQKSNFDFTSGEDNLKYFDIIINRMQKEFNVPIIIYYIGNYQNIEDVFENRYQGNNSIYYVPVNKKLDSKDRFIIDEHTNKIGQAKTAGLILEKIHSENLLK